MASLASRRVEGAEDAVGDRAAEVADAGESWARVVNSIDQLPDAERDTLMLFAWEELSYDDIAAALDVPVGTARSRLNRARRRSGHSGLRGWESISLGCGAPVHPRRSVLEWPAATEVARDDELVSELQRLER